MKQKNIIYWKSFYYTNSTKGRSETTQYYAGTAHYAFASENDLDITATVKYIIKRESANKLFNPINKRKVEYDKFNNVYLMFSFFNEINL